MNTERTGHRIRVATGAGLLCLAFALAAASCASVQRDVLYDAPGGEEPAELAGLESALVRSRAVAGSSDLQGARRRLAELASVPSSDSQRMARILSLSAEAALQAGDKAAAARLRAQSQAAWSGDEFAVVVRSRLAGNLDERLAILEQAAAGNVGAYRVKAELGSALLARGRTREALAAFDASLPFLDDAWGLLYGDERARAWALRDAEVAPGSDSAAYLGREPIQLVGMAVLAQAETNALDRITGDANWAPGVLYERLKASNWYADPAAPPRAPATRKDAALFLWMLMTRGEPKVALRYTARYAARATSPVPDVTYGSPYFDAVLGVVEEGVMSLVDGVRFDPDTSVSGLDFYGWLMLAAAWR